MCSWLVQLISFAKVKNYLFWVFKWILEVYEMEHKVTNGKENYVLCKRLWYSHCLRLLTLLIFFWAPQRSFSESLKVVQVAHEIACGFWKYVILILCSPLVFLFLNCLLKLLIEYFLKNTFPDIFFLPDSMIVDELGKILFLVFLFFVDLIIILLKVNHLTAIQYCIDHFEIDIFLVDDGGQEILYELS